MIRTRRRVRYRRLARFRLDAGTTLFRYAVPQRSSVNVNSVSKSFVSAVQPRRRRSSVVRARLSSSVLRTAATMKRLGETSSDCAKRSKPSDLDECSTVVQDRLTASTSASTDHVVNKTTSKPSKNNGPTNYFDSKKLFVEQQAAADLLYEHLWSPD